MQAVHPPACFFPISPRSRTRALAVPQQAKGDTASTGNGNGKTRLVIKGTVTPSRAAPFFQPSGEQTPNISEAAEKIRRSLSVASLHDLAHMKPKELRKQIASKVWRAQDEQVRIPTDWERLAVHVVRGTIRAGNLAFSLRATMTLVLGLIKALRTHKFQGQTLVRSMFGLDAWRFAGMFGHWAALYKATHNSLRLLTPFPTKRPRSLSQKNIAHDTPGTSSSTALSASSTDVLSTLDARSISNSRSTPFFDVRADRHVSASLHDDSCASLDQLICALRTEQTRSSGEVWTSADWPTGRLADKGSARHDKFLPATPSAHTCTPGAGRRADGQRRSSLAVVVPTRLDYD
ncbi:hypothetical protein CF336_g8312 [Tilletia laevis]|nr:hypothetical protein CF328_g8513 [Tilletia controversa]KAE8183066.1 hypothetical protein CF336_g8312 [Tilletia laevis]